MVVQKVGQECRWGSWEGSSFHDHNGYCAQAVGPETAILPDGWLNRVHRVQNAATNDRVGYCLDVADPFMSKAAAGRDKHRVFCMALRQHGCVKPSRLIASIADMPLDPPEQRRLRATIQRWIRALREAGHDLVDD